MGAPVIQTSFASGEFSPTLYARVDLAKYKVGAARLKNFYVDYRGGASTREGLEFCARCYSGTAYTRLIPFVFSQSQAYVLEFSDGRMRPLRNGAHILNPSVNITAITNANPGVVTAPGHGLSTGDWIYLSDIGGMIELNGRTLIAQVLSANTFSLTTLSGAPINTTSYTAYTSGGTVASVVTVVSPYPTAALSGLKYAQSNDVLTIVHPDYPPYNLSRASDTSWTFAPIVLGTALTGPTGLTAGSPGAGGVFYAYKVTAVDKNNNESVPIECIGFTALDISTGAGSNIVITWNPVAGAERYNVYKSTPIRDVSATWPGNSNLAASLDYGYMTTSTTTTHGQDANIVPDFTKGPPQHRDPFSPGQITRITITSGGAGYTSVPAVTITGGGGSGAIALAEIWNGEVSAVIIVNPGKGYTSAPTIGFTGGGGAGAAATATIGPTSGTYPSVVSYFQQRRVFAATDNLPDAIWMSRPAQFTDFNVSNPTIDSDAVTIALSALQVNRIKYMVPMPGGLIVLTDYGAWQISGGGQNTAVTPTSVQAQAQAYNGISDVRPLTINYDILYVAAKGASVRDLAYNFAANIYAGVDISVLSNHLFYGYTIVNWDYAEEPFKRIWAVRSDGILLCCTFLKEQEMYGWTHHDTDGLFQDVCVIPEGNEHVAYFIVQRYINNETVQYIERMVSRNWTNREDSWCLDCALSTVLETPQAFVDASGTSGSVVIHSDVNIFSNADIGKTIRMGGGIGVVTGYTSPTEIAANFTTPIRDIIGSEFSGQHTYYGHSAPGEWSLGTKVSTVRGLEHLEGQEVWIVGDGERLENRTVVDGTVTLSTPSSLVRIGLPYRCQLQTLPLDISGTTETVQSKRKKISALTVRIAQGYGFKLGEDFSTLYNWTPNVQNFAGTQIGGFYSGDYRRILGGAYDEQAQLAIEQSEPFPVTVLGIIPEVTVGDDNTGVRVGGRK